MKKFTLALLAFINIFIFATFPTKAASMSAFIDAPSSAVEGSRFTVTVRFESEIPAFVTATLSYDNSAVEFISSSSSDINNMGNYFNITPMSSKTSHKFDFTFKMKTNGNATFSTKVTESYDINLNSLGSPSDSHTVKSYIPTIEPTAKPTAKPTTKPTAKPTAVKTPKPTSNPTLKPTEDIITTQTPLITSTPTNSITPSPAPTPSNSMEFLYNGEIRYISEDFDENTVLLPEGFDKTAYNFKNNNIFVAKNADDIIMVYATDILGQNGKFYIYSGKHNSFTPYEEIILGNNTYIFIKPYNIPAGFKETTVDIGEYTNLIAYSFPSALHSDFLALYGFSIGAKPTYYIYDTIENTIQRCIDITYFTESKVSASVSTPSIKPSETPTQNKPEDEIISSDNNITSSKSTDNPFKDSYDNFYNFLENNKKMVLATLIILVVILLIISIALYIRKKSHIEDINNEKDNINTNENEGILDTNAMNNNESEENLLENEKNCNEYEESISSKLTLSDTSIKPSENENAAVSEDNISSPAPRLNINEILKNDDSDDDLKINN